MKGPLIPGARNIRSFQSARAFETWLAANHVRKREIYLRIYKKDSGKATITYLEALEVALCWGWIDGVRKSFDDRSYLQRFTPRGARSVWSQINQTHVARLIADGRMTPHGLAHVTSAKADGRWQAAYASPKTMTIPQDLLVAVQAEPRAWRTFVGLNRQNLYALSYRLGTLKTAAGRVKRIAAFVEMLKQGKTLYPNGKGKSGVPA